MKNVLIIIIMVFISVGCKDQKTDASMEAPEKEIIEKIADEAGKIFSENVYGLKKNGEKGQIVFIIEGTKLFAAKKDGSKDGLMLEKRGDKVYDFSKGQNGSKVVFIYEGNKYWEIDKKTGGKGNLIFERKGDDIYQTSKNKTSKAFFIQ